MQPLVGEVVFLGTGTSHGIPVIGCHCAVCRSEDRRNRRYRCAIAVGLPLGGLLIDAPPELRLALIREDIPLIHAFALTHAHVDHLFGADDLRVMPNRLGTPLPIYCRTQDAKEIHRVFSYAFDPSLTQASTAAPLSFEFHEINALDATPFEVLGAKIVPIPMHHHVNDAVGYRIGSFAYCTDVVSFPETSYERLKGVKTLVLDALRHRSHPCHQTIAQAIEVANRVGAEEVYLTHLSHDIDHATLEEELPPHIHPAYDGLRLQIPVI
ncbi:MAG: MBL fold metallo-hydrolase [Thermoguttaceae bacterium]|nr:MBL fold metallo-hydrolase [Thermoguttaceae bacterium]